MWKVMFKKSLGLANVRRTISSRGKEGKSRELPREFV